MKYIVKINYNYFTFDDGTDALNFAGLAKNAANDRDCHVEIILVEEEEA